jgi:phosphoribosylpyrophosphate synthetase
MEEQDLIDDGDKIQYGIVWIEENIENIMHLTISCIKLRLITDFLRTFDNINQCKNYIQGIKGAKKIFLCVSFTYAVELLTEIHDMHQIHTIYVYNTNSNKPINQECFAKYAKVSLNNRFCEIRAEREC